jgi:hypothetical protein
VPQGRLPWGRFFGSELGYTQVLMLWFTLWFMVILKIPALYLCYVIWWAVKDPPAAAPGTSGEGFGGGGLEPPRRRGPRAPAPGRHPRPHGRCDRRRQAEPVLAGRVRRAS